MVIFAVLFLVIYFGEKKETKIMKGIFLDIDGVLNDMLTRGVMHWNSTFVNNYFLKKRLVQTKSLHELTNENINEAIEMLK